MKLVFGLGNPGSKYRDTKHNIGFAVLDELVFQEGVAFNKSKFESVYAEGRIGAEKVLFVKPQTFMNNSGRAVRAWLDYYNLTEEDILVIYDDMDMPVGKIRLRQKGGPGGHNGMKSITQHLGTKEFNRIKIGIGRPFPNQPVTAHVLSGFNKEDHEDMLSSVKSATEATQHWLEGHPFPETMSKFN